MVEIIYDNITKGGTKNIVEYWSDKKSLARFNFLKSDGDFANIKMRHITFLEYLNNYEFKGWQNASPVL